MDLAITLLRLALSAAALLLFVQAIVVHDDVPCMWRHLLLGFFLLGGSWALRAAA